MEKLIELLSEFGEYDLVENNGEICKWDTDYEGEINIYTDYTNNIISKKFGFIKWLVENDKIDIDKLKFQSDFMFPLWKDFDQLGSEEIIEYSDYESLLMLLSISDTPIEFLVSILK